MNIAKISPYSIKNISFQSKNEIETSKRIKKGTNINREDVYNRPTTHCFRDDLNWDILFDYFKKEYKNEPKVNVYDYACSSGLESYSLSVLFQETQDNPKRFFPIIAKDIDANQIRKNQLFKNLINSDIYDDNIYRRAEKYCNIPPDKLSKYLKHIHDPDNIGNDRYVFKLNATRPVKFEHANILDDISKIDNKNPSIIFARNMWEYVDKIEYRDFAKDLYKRLKSGSTIIIGYYDVQDDNDNKRDYSIKDALINAGFRPILAKCVNKNYPKTDYLVFKKY